MKKIIICIFATLILSTSICISLSVSASATVPWLLLSRVVHDDDDEVNTESKPTDETANKKSVQKSSEQDSIDKKTDASLNKQESEIKLDKIDKIFLMIFIISWPVVGIIAYFILSISDSRREDRLCKIIAENCAKRPEKVYIIIRSKCYKCKKR